MKTLSKLLIVAGLFAFVACGPSAKEKEAAQAKQDSIAAASKADSIAKVEAVKAKADSIAAKVKADSIAKVDSIAAASKKGGKKK